MKPVCRRMPIIFAETDTLDRNIGRIDMLQRLNELSGAPDPVMPAIAEE